MPSRRAGVGAGGVVVGVGCVVGVVAGCFPHDVAPDFGLPAPSDAGPVIIELPDAADPGCRTDPSDDGCVGIASGTWVHERVTEDAALLGPIGIALDDDGSPHLVFSHADDHQLSYAHRSRSAWQVENKTLPGHVATRAASIAFGAGALHIAFVDDNTASAVYALREGCAFTEATAIEPVTPASDAAVAVDADGAVHIVFGHVRHARRHDDGSFFVEDVVRSPTFARRHGIAGAGSVAFIDGGAHDAESDVEDDAPGDATVATLVDGLWRTREVVIGSATAIAIAALPDGSTSDAVVAAGAVAVDGTATPFHDSGFGEGALAYAVDAAGRRHLVHDDVRLLYARSDGGAFADDVADESIEFAHQPAMAVGANGVVWVAYNDPFALAVAHRCP